MFMLSHPDDPRRYGGFRGWVSNPHIAQIAQIPWESGVIQGDRAKLCQSKIDDF